VRFKFFILFAFLTFFILTSVSFVSAQEATDKSKAETTEKKDKKQKNKQPANDLTKGSTAEQVAESMVYFYGGLGGREYLKQIRKTTIERGKITVTNAEGKTEQANYERLILRGDSLDKERIRFDQEYPSAKFALLAFLTKLFSRRAKMRQKLSKIKFGTDSKHFCATKKTVRRWRLPNARKLWA
jgi:lipopolysaccharide export LptBFGC system permease protein LptF